MNADGTHFKVIVDLLVTQNPPNTDVFVDCLARMPEIKQGLNGILERISQEQETVKMRLFSLAMDIIIKLKADGMARLEFSWDDLFLLLTRIVCYDPSPGSYDLYEKLRHALYHIYELIPVDRNDVTIAALKTSGSKTCLFSLAIFCSYASIRIGTCLSAILQDVHQGGAVLLALSHILRKCRREELDNRILIHLSPDKLIGHINSLLLSPFPFKNEIGLHLIASLQYFYNDYDGLMVVATFATGFIFKTLEHGNKTELDLVSDIMAAMHVSDAYPTFTVSRQISSFMLKAAEQIDDYEGTYCRKVLEFANKRRGNKMFGVTMEMMPLDPRMYSTALYITVSCDELPEFVHLLFPSILDPEFLISYCRGYLFVKNRGISQEMARHIVPCIMNILCHEESGHGELKSLLVTVLEDMAKKFTGLVFNSFMSIMEKIKTSFMIVTVAHFLIKNFSQDILPKYDYHSVYLKSVAVATSTIVSPTLPIEWKETLVRFLAMIEPTFPDSSHRSLPIETNVISLHNRFVPKYVRQEYIAIVEDMYHASYVYGVNLVACDISDDTLKRLIDVATDQSNKSDACYINYFVSFFDTWACVSLEKTLACLAKLVKSNMRLFKIPNPKFVVALLRVLTFICKHFVNVPKEFYNILDKIAKKVLLVKKNTPEVQNEGVEFVKAFSENIRLIPPEPTTVKELLGFTPYVQFCGGLLVKINQKDSEILKYVAATWMVALRERNWADTSKNTDVVEALLNYYSDDVAVELIIEAVMTFIKDDVNIWEQMNFLNTLVYVADTRKMAYNITSLQAILTPAKFLLSPDDSLRISSNEYFLRLFHIPYQVNQEEPADEPRDRESMMGSARLGAMDMFPERKRDMPFVRPVHRRMFGMEPGMEPDDVREEPRIPVRSDRSESRDDAESRDKDKEYLKYLKEATSLADRKTIAVYILTQGFQKCDQQFCDRLFLHMAENIAVIDLYHVIIITALLQTKITFTSEGFGKFVGNSYRSLAAFDATARAIIKKAESDFPGFVKFCLTHEFTPLIQAVLQKISKISADRILLVDNYLSLIKQDERSLHVDTKYKFLLAIGHDDARDINQQYVGKLLLATLLLLGNQFETVNMCDLDELSRIFGVLTSSPHVSFCTTTVQDLNISIMNFAYCITSIDPEQMREFYESCGECISGAAECRKSAATIGALLIHSVHLFTEYGSLSARKMREKLWDILITLFEKAHPLSGPVLMYVLAYMIAFDQLNLEIVANEKRKAIFNSVLSMVVKMDKSQLANGIEVLCFIFPHLDPEGKPLTQVFDMSKFCGCLKEALNYVPMTPIIMKCLRHMCRNDVDPRGDPNITMLNNIELMVYTCSTDDRLRTPAIELFEALFKVNTPDMVMQLFSSRIATGEIVSAMPRMIANATPENIDLEWMKILCSLAGQLKSESQNLAGFYEKFFKLCMALSCMPEHPCHSTALAAISSIA